MEEAAAAAAAAAPAAAAPAAAAPAAAAPAAAAPAAAAPAAAAPAGLSVEEALEAERARHRARAAKFGAPYVDPGATRREFRDGARREHLAAAGAPKPFATGFDLFAPEEAAKRGARAERFGTATTGLEWAPPVEDAAAAAARRARAERFGVAYTAPDATGMMEVDLQKARAEAPAGAARRPEAVHVYGVDLLSTRDLLNYFADYGSSYVEWINDSSANVLFADEHSARRAIAALGKPLPPDEAVPGDAAAPGAGLELEACWHRGADAVKGGAAVPVIFRTATAADVKPAAREPSRRLWVGAAGGGGGRRQGGGRQRRSGGGAEGGVAKPRGRGRARQQQQRRGGGDAEMGEAGEAGHAGGGGGGEGASRFPEREQVHYGDI
jgi:hypothetical protein